MFLSLRLIPRNVRPIEGKRHANTTLVKLLCSENSKGSNNVGAMFARSMIQHLEKGAGFLHPAEVIFHSQDNKAKVPIGLTAANRRAPLVMHVEYKVKLPNHDFITAMQNKLVPLIIGDMQVSLQMLRHIQNQFI